MELETSQIVSLFSAIPGLCSLDEDVQQFLAGIVADDPSELEASFDDSLGPFLEDSGSSEESVKRSCAELREALRNRTGKSILKKEFNDEDTRNELLPEPQKTSQLNVAQEDRSSSVPKEGASTQVQPAPLVPQSSLSVSPPPLQQQTASRAEVPRRPEEVRRILEGCLAPFPPVDGDILDYAAAGVAEDAGETEATFEDALGPLLQGALPGLTDADVRSVCNALRAALDEGGAASVPAAAPGGESSCRRLEGGPVCLGDIGDESGSDLHGGSSLKAHLASKARREERKLQERLSAREQEAARRKAAAEERARARAEAAAERLQELSTDSGLAAESTVSRKGGAGVANSRDVFVPEFTLPSHGGGQNLLDSAMLRLMHGHRYGLVGRNGMGKSTLLATLAAGRVPGVPEKLSILHVAQDSADKIAAGSRVEGATALDAVIQSDTQRTELLRRAGELSSGEELDEVYEALEAIDADGAPGRAAAILRGLQFDEGMMAQPVASLSGGWRMRVSIAAALFLRPDVLLLDEPTNHLDLEAVLWLGQHLEGWDDRTLVVVSHDRAFLNQVCTDVIHLENRTLAYYPGTFYTFVAVRDERRERQRRQYEQQEAKRREMELYVQKHLHKGQSLVRDDAQVKQAKKVAKQIERLGTLGQDGKKYKLSYDGPQQAAELPEDEKGLSGFTFPVPERVHAGAAVIQVKEVTFCYPGASRPIFEGLNFNVGLTTRCALLGRNGSGKSTLLKLITGRLAPTEGEVLRSHHLRVATFTQHHMDQLDLTKSPLEHLLEHGRATEPALTPDEVRRRIGRFGMSGHWQTQPIRTLSGGQKSRVAFCKATWSVPHILLLDEPTNHLDMETIDSLIEAVKKFEGGILCVSHDERFLKSVTDEFWVVGEGATGLARLDGSFSDYKKAMLRSLRRK